jgi:hypothetical protein
MLAATLVHGVPRLAHFEQQHMQDELHQLSQRIHVQSSATVTPWTCTLELTSRAGRVHRQHFHPDTPFRLDWEQTLLLTSAVVQEWALPKALDKFNRLVASVVKIETQDLALLGCVIYTR